MKTDYREPIDRTARATLGVALLAACMLAGCATERVAPVESRLVYQSVRTGAHPALNHVVDSVAGTAPAALRLTSDGALESQADYRLELDFAVRDKGLSDTEAVWTQTTVMLLTLYPSTCGHYELELTGELYDQYGNRLKTWHSVEQDTAFLWLFSGNDCGDTQSEGTVQKIAEHMLEDLYARISRDGILSGREVVPVQDFPLVYVDAVNASSVIERVTKTDEPFANFTFDRETGTTADKTVKIWFYFNAADQSMASVMGRGAGAIFTLGLMSMCPPNEMVLNAEVLANDGTVIKTYRFAKKKRASSLDYCAAPTDKTHPKLATNLLQKLFKQIKKDRVI